MVFALAAVAPVGCGKNDGHVKVYSVSGKVLVHGTPAEGARVVFYPVSDKLKGPHMPLPAGNTDAAGEFRLGSYKVDDGAPAGDYKVAITWPEPIPPNANPETFQRKDKLGGRYNDPEKSGLTATVEKSGEIHPFDLK